MRRVSLLATVSIGTMLAAGAALAQSPLPVYPQAAPMQAAPTTMYAPTPVRDWDGPYLGIALGYTFGSATATHTGTTEVLPLSGFVAGGIFGVNWQLNQWVFGVMSEVGWTFASADASFVGGTHVDTSLIGSFRARAGYAFDNFMVYGALGPAWQRVTVSSPGIADHTQVHGGFAIGAGIETAINDTLNIRAEAVYARFADLTYANAVTVTPSRIDLRISVTMPLGAR